MTVVFQFRLDIIGVDSRGVQQASYYILISRTLRASNSSILSLFVYVCRAFARLSNESEGQITEKCFSIARDKWSCERTGSRYQERFGHKWIHTDPNILLVFKEHNCKFGNNALISRSMTLVGVVKMRMKMRLLLIFSVSALLWQRDLQSDTMETIIPQGKVLDFVEYWLIEVISSEYLWWLRSQKLSNDLGS
ncbi:hypothetical protein FF38_11290 [Lucilia cuprina]|uniref:Uncharacterized protein n=1 Tax=Lucilia cuprina TaxID=7375 RepID=A0A0L0CIZ8_LUCCU|nr:hypothetical protein FF38_11290 [Lucilia cuprina]